MENLSSPVSASPRSDMPPGSSVFKSRETSSAHSNQPLNALSSPIDPLVTSVHDYNFSGIYDESSTQSEREDFTDDDMTQAQETTSSRSSISSLPASVTPSMMAQSPDASTPTKNSVAGTGRLSNLSNRIQSPNGRLEKDHGSPFRHPSSVIAMQMRDEDEIMSQRRRGSAMTGRLSSFSSRTSTPHLPSKRNSRSMSFSPQKPKVKKEYPLVLLHFTLLPPVLPLQTKVTDPLLLHEILPQEYWRRWKLLNDKITDNGEVSTRGVLIPHPKGDYDLLEERLLESLELAKPRIRSGHFLGDDPQTVEESGSSKEDNEESDIAEQGSKCPDCGSRILEDPDRDRKWEIKVYAANGLMRAGAWSAAWNEMEKVDVEVGVWLPEAARRQIEETLRDIGITAEQAQPPPQAEAEPEESPEEIRRREIYGDSQYSQERIDGLFDGPSRAADAPRREKRHRSRKHEHQPVREPDMRTLLLNYIRVISQDRRNVVIAILSVAMLLIALSRSPEPEPAIAPLQPVPVPVPAIATASQQCTSIEASASQILRAPSPELSVQTIPKDQQISRDETEREVDRDVKASDGKEVRREDKKKDAAEGLDKKQDE